MKLGNKKNIWLYLGNFLCLCIAYSVYLFEKHYSEDSFEAMLNIGAMANTNLRNGRVVHYFLYSTLSKLNWNILEHQTFTQIVMTLVITWGITKIALRFAELLDIKDNKDSLLALIIIDMAMLVCFINPSFQFGWYYWPETCLGASLSLFVTFLAILFMCKFKLTVVDVVLSFVFCTLSISMYQVYVEMYVGICIVYILLKYQFKLSIDSFKWSAVTVAIGGVGSVLNIALMKYLQDAGFIYKDERSASDSGTIIIENFRYILNMQKSIWHSMTGLLPEGLLSGMIFLLLLLFLLSLFFTKTKVNALDFIYIIVCTLGIWVLAFVPNIISGTVWLAPRTYWGIFAIIVLLIIYILYVIKDSSSIMKALTVIVGCFLIILAVQSLRLEKDTIVSNRLDKEEIDAIVSNIKDYEAQSGQDVEVLHYAYDISRSYCYNQVQLQAYDNNVRGMAYAWCFQNMIYYYYPNEFIVANSSDEETMQICGFEDWNWDHLDLTEQMHFENNEAYIVIY